MIVPVAICKVPVSHLAFPLQGCSRWLLVYECPSTWVFPVPKNSCIVHCFYCVLQLDTANSARPSISAFWGRQKRNLLCFQLFILFEVIPKGLQQIGGFWIDSLLVFTCIIKIFNHPDILAVYLKKLFEIIM